LAFLKRKRAAEATLVVSSVARYDCAMWRLMQTVIVFAVIASNIHYQWTPNPYLAAIIAFVAAFIATWLLSWAFDLRHWIRRKRGLPAQRPR
jgi:hypothetical protein